jgi:hypothetical protein
MIGTHYILPALLGLLLVAGCSQHVVRTPHGESSSLHQWVDGELAPWVAQQLGQHPRFRGEPVIIVRFDGDDIQPDIDGLTRRIRNQLMDSMLNTPGVNVPWQPQQPAQQHHRRLDQVRCGRLRDASYYIGIEITRTTTAQFRVSVRALDVQAGEWVSGFSQNWSGSLTAAELRALQERRTDESLRGLRVLPFSTGQTDLAAAYLANNLSCLLRQQDVEDLKIWVESPGSAAKPLRSLLDLVGNNLSRYREVQVTDSVRQANFILRGEMHRIRPDLHQVWVVLQPKGSGMHLAGMDTATWLRVQPDGDRPAGRSVAQTGRDVKPSIARMELVRRAGGEGNGVACGSGDCPVLEVDVEHADAVFVIAHGNRDGISKLSGECVSADVTQTYPGRFRYRYPESRFTASDWPTVYAVAVRGDVPQQQVSRLMEDLPDACRPAGRGMTHAGSQDQWLDRLDGVIAANRDYTVWTARRLP